MTAEYPRPSTAYSQSDPKYFILDTTHSRPSTAYSRPTTALTLCSIEDVAEMKKQLMQLEKLKAENQLQLEFLTDQHIQERRQLEEREIQLQQLQEMNENNVDLSQLLEQLPLNEPETL